jgi:hypothetical protein
MTEREVDLVLSAALAVVTNPKVRADIVTRVLSVAPEKPDTGLKQLKTEISELAGGLEMLINDGRLSNHNMAFYIERLRLLSAD